MRQQTTPSPLSLGWVQEALPFLPLDKLLLVAPFLTTAKVTFLSFCFFRLSDLTVSLVYFSLSKQAIVGGTTKDATISYASNTTAAIGDNASIPNFFVSLNFYDYNYTSMPNWRQCMVLLPLTTLRGSLSLLALAISSTILHKEVEHLQKAHSQVLLLRPPSPSLSLLLLPLVGSCCN